MQKQNKQFEDLFDIFAIRIIVDKVEECYAVLGVRDTLNNIRKPFDGQAAFFKVDFKMSISSMLFGSTFELLNFLLQN